MLINGHLTSSRFKRRVVNMPWSSWCMNCSPDMTWSAASGYERLETRHTHQNWDIKHTVYLGYWLIHPCCHGIKLNLSFTYSYVLTNHICICLLFYAVTMSKVFKLQKEKNHCKIIPVAYCLLALFHCMVRYGSARLGTVRYGSVRVGLHFHRSLVPL